MMRPSIEVRELSAWDLDAYPHRTSCPAPKSLAEARRLVAARGPYATVSPLVEPCPEPLFDSLQLCASRPDLHAEVTGLDWSVGLVDLRCLLAFQRRLSLDPQREAPLSPRADDWNALLDVCFGAEKPLFCRLEESLPPSPTSRELVLTSHDPNLQLRASPDPATPFVMHAGSPFFEVAEYRGRWFLRDGYHRAYRLLRANVPQVPAVIVRARTLEELGATRPWFFREETLFSPTPPRVVDFLDDALVLQYKRPPLIKTFRVTIEESLELAHPSGDPS
jgi:hypothetical protein